MARTAKVPKSSDASPSSHGTATSQPARQSQADATKPSSEGAAAVPTATELGYERSYGDASNKFEGKLVALRLFDKYQSKQNYSLFKELTYDDVESDNLQHIIRRFAAWLANFDMPRYYNEKFEPRSTTANGLVALMEPSTKRKYVERVKAALREKFPKHPDWSDQNKWWTLLMANFDTEAKRNKIKSQGSDVLSNRSVRPLYKRNTPGKIQMLRDMELFRDIDIIDLTYICRKVSLHTLFVALTF